MVTEQSNVRCGLRSRGLMQDATLTYAEKDSSTPQNVPQG